MRLPAARPTRQAPGGPQSEYAIEAGSSLEERKTKTLKHNDTFAVFDTNGDIISGPGNPEGLYHRDTRYLSHLELTLGGKRPLLLSSTVRSDNAVLSCDLTNPDIAGRDGHAPIEHDRIICAGRASCGTTPASSCSRLRNFD